MNNVTLEELKTIPTLQTVPDDQLQWFLDAGDTIEIQEGNGFLKKASL
jgi:hypothetical protein